jgi:hypothetical protein
MRGSREVRATSRLRSVEPSSIARTSKRAKVCARTLSIASPTYAARL